MERLAKLVEKGAGNLDRLADLVDQVRPSADEVLFDSDGKVFKARGLVKNHRFAIAIAEGVAGCRVERHGHPGIEWIIVLSGRLKVIFNGSDLDLERGEAVMVPAGEAHAVVTLKDTETLAITIPADEGFPDA